jgi:hypothetical protein
MRTETDLHTIEVIARMLTSVTIKRRLLSSTRVRFVPTSSSPLPPLTSRHTTP